MTTFNLQAKFSDRSFNQTTENDIKNVMLLVRVLLYPKRLFSSLSIIKDIVLTRLHMNIVIAKFKLSFNKSDEFTRMDSLAEISFLRETIGKIVSKVQHLHNNGKSSIPLIDNILSMILGIYTTLHNVEKQYHKKIYIDAPDSDSEEFKEALKKTYAGFELEK